MPVKSILNHFLTLLLVVFSYCMLLGCQPASLYIGPKKKSKNFLQAQKLSTSYTQDLLQAETDALQQQMQLYEKEIKTELIQFKTSINMTPFTEPTALQMATIDWERFSDNMSKYAKYQKIHILKMRAFLPDFEEKIKLLHKKLAKFPRSWKKHCSSGIGFPITAPRYTKELDLKLNTFTVMLTARQNKILDSESELKIILKELSNKNLRQEYERNCLELANLFFTPNNSSKFHELKTYVTFLLGAETSPLQKLSRYIDETEQDYYFLKKPFILQTQALILYLSRLDLQYAEEHLSFNPNTVKKQLTNMNQRAIQFITKFLQKNRTEACTQLNTETFNFIELNNLQEIDRIYLQERDTHIKNSFLPFCEETPITSQL